MIFRSKKISELFSIDRRSLAVFRVAMAVILLFDLANRATSLRAHYTDFGVLPRSVLLEKFSGLFNFSFHLSNGQVWFQSLLFIVAAIFGFFLLIGYRTRFATLISWVLICSLQNRNYMLAQGGDVLFRLLLFWSLFLPLGSAWSVDEALNPSHSKTPKRFISMATIAILLQTALVYWVGAVYKFQGSAWSWGDASAVYRALQIDQFTTGIGLYLSQFPELLRWLTRWSLIIEVAGPTLAFLPYKIGPLRSIVVFLMISLHLGFATCMNLGTFPFISAASWLLFVPAWYWDRIERRWSRPQRFAFRVFYDDRFPVIRKRLQIFQTFLIIPRHLLREAQSFPVMAQEMGSSLWLVLDHRGNRYEGWDAWIFLLKQSPLFWPLAWFALPVSFVGKKLLRRCAKKDQENPCGPYWMKEKPRKYSHTYWVDVVVGFLLLYMLAWNVRETNFKLHENWFPQELNGLGNILRLDQSWNMFAPQPTTDDGWYVIPGTLKNGREVDLMTGKAVTWQKPALVSSMYPSQRWRKYMMNLFSKEQKEHRLYFGRYLCRSWNRGRSDSEHLYHFTINFMYEQTRLNGPRKPEKILLWEHYCFKVPDNSQKTLNVPEPKPELSSTSTN